jgi:hypothetical protein
MFEGFKNIFKNPDETIGDKKEKKPEIDLSPRGEVLTEREQKEKKEQFKKGYDAWRDDRN